MATVTLCSDNLLGKGSLVTTEIDSSTTFKVTKTGGNNILYLTFDVEEGGSTTVPGLGNSNFTSRDDNGINLHPAFSNTNFAYCLNRGTYDSGDVIFADDLPTIPANTLRVRMVGFPGNTDVFLTIGTGGGAAGSLPALLP